MGKSERRPLDDDERVREALTEPLTPLSCSNLSLHLSLSPSTSLSLSLSLSLSPPFLTTTHCSIYIDIPSFLTDRSTIVLFRYYAAVAGLDSLFGRFDDKLGEMNLKARRCRPVGGPPGTLSIPPLPPYLPPLSLSSLSLSHIIPFRIKQGNTVVVFASDHGEMLQVIFTFQHSCV